MGSILRIRREQPTREAIVVTVGEVIIDEDWVGVVFILEAPLHAIDLRLRNFKTGPAIPLEAGCFGQTAKAGDETT
jgi:hypothetical protein